MGKSQENIRDIIMQAVEAGRISAERTAKDAFKATERRLYGLPALKIKLEDDLERLEEFKLYGPRERSKSITRFVKNGNRLTPDEIWEAVLIEVKGYDEFLSMTDKEAREAYNALPWVECIAVDINTP